MNSQNFGPGDNRALPIKEALADLPADEKKSTLQRWRDSLKRLAGPPKAVEIVAAPGSELERELREEALSDAALDMAEQEGPDCPRCGAITQRRVAGLQEYFSCTHCGYWWDQAIEPEPEPRELDLECPNCGLGFVSIAAPDGSRLGCPRCGLMIAVFETFREANARLLDNQVKDARDFMAAVLPPKMVKRRLAQALHALDTAIERLEEVKRHEIETGQWPGKALNTMLEDLDGERERLFGYAERRYKVKRSVLRAYR